MRRKLLYVIGGLAVLLAIGAYLQMTADTGEKRTEMSHHIWALKAKLERNSHDEAAMSELRAILRSNWPFAKVKTCVVLEELGPKATPFIDDLIRELDSKDHAVQREAAMALGTVAVGTDRAVMPLVKQLSSNWDVSTFSARSLGQIGIHAKDAIPALEVAANGDREWMKEPARKSLEAIKDAIAKQESNKN